MTVSVVLCGQLVFSVLGPASRPVQQLWQGATRLLAELALPSSRSPYPPPCRFSCPLPLQGDCSDRGPGNGPTDRGPARSPEDHAEVSDAVRDVCSSIYILIRWLRRLNWQHALDMSPVAIVSNVVLVILHPAL